MSTITAIADAITRFEGFFPGSVSYRNNNPGNLVYVGQAGATPVQVTGSDGKVRTFARFETPEAGRAALEGQIALDASRGLTLRQLIYKWAPPSDNNPTDKYLASIANNTGLTPDDPIAGSGTSTAAGSGAAAYFPAADAVPASAGFNVDLASAVSDMQVTPMGLALAIGAGLFMFFVSQWVTE